VRVLHVEDDAAIAELYGFALTTLGNHEVTLRSDGQSGLDAALRGSFDVIILDLHLPLLGGKELLECLRQADVRPQPPVIVLTSDDDPATHRSLIAAGATACLCKASTTPRDLVLHLAGAAARASGADGHGRVEATPPPPDDGSGPGDPRPDAAAAAPVTRPDGARPAA
jgi:CheY-like chemotaxis protein